ncbi:gem-associated protein 6-like [Apostichopus japonicus]|uniref:gem-associated protein 6-like n=1 Tax=Stichopus japonicus TaxID=307972 RepID=UPI003AB11218
MEPVISHGESQTMNRSSESNQDSFTAEQIRAMTPNDLRRFVDKTVCIKCGTNNEEVSGTVYTVDPVSTSFVISNFADNQGQNSNLTVIPGHSLRLVTVTGICNEEQKQLLTEAFGNFVNSNKTPISDLENRKAELLQWFAKNRIPAQLAGEHDELIQVTDALFIEPPYQPENCLSRNEIILGKVQSLVKSMPT